MTNIWKLEFVQLCAWMGVACLLLFIFISLASESVPLRRNTLLSSFTSSLSLRTFGVHFVLEYTFTSLLSLGFVNLMGGCG